MTEQETAIERASEIISQYGDGLARTDECFNALVDTFQTVNRMEKGPKSILFKVQASVRLEVLMLDGVENLFLLSINDSPYRLIRNDRYDIGYAIVKALEEAKLGYELEEVLE